LPGSGLLQGGGTLANKLGARGAGNASQYHGKPRDKKECVPCKPGHSSRAILFQKLARISSLSRCDLWGQALQPDEMGKVSKANAGERPSVASDWLEGLYAAQPHSSPCDSLTESERNGRLK
jgi:hypothetical protein